MVGIDRASTAAFSTEALSPISVPDSGSISVLNQFGSAGGRGLETPPTVSDHAVLMIVAYWSFSTSLWPLKVHYRHQYPMQYPRN